MAGTEHAAGEALAGGADVDRRLHEAADVLDMIARRVGRRLGGHIELDELKAYGHEAMLQIVTAYDPARASFRAYAALKLKWAIYDGLRQSTHGRAGNRVRALMASERVAASWAADLGKGEDAGDDGVLPREPNEADYEERLRSMLETQAAALAVGLLVGPDDHDALVDEATSPEDRVVNKQSRAAVQRAIAALPERERTVIVRHYFDDDRFDRIAVDLGISKSRASRLHTRAILRLARALQEQGE